MMKTCDKICVEGNSFSINGKQYKGFYKDGEKK